MPIGTSWCSALLSLKIQAVRWGEVADRQPGVTLNTSRRPLGGLFGRAQGAERHLMTRSVPLSRRLIASVRPNLFGSCPMCKNLACGLRVQVQGTRSHGGLSYLDEVAGSRM
jgi:hypothetical protein